MIIDIIVIIIFVVMMILEGVFFKRKGYFKIFIISLILILIIVGIFIYYENYSVQTLSSNTDTSKIEIILEGEDVVKYSYLNDYIEPGYVAKDLCCGELTDKVQVIKEDIDDFNYNLIYKVEDEYGNKAEKIRKVMKIDDVAPTITLNDAPNIKLLVGESYNETGAKAIDEIDGDISDKIQIEGEVDTSTCGFYQINYKVLDNSGNEATITKNVEVSDNKKKVTVAPDSNNSSNGIIYLTFDDGPTSSITPQILDVLKEKNVKATFFIINYNDTTEHLIKREIDEGHTVGIHGYSHSYSTIYRSVDTYINNITKLQDKVRETTGYNTIITRFPGGSSNTVSRKYCPGIMTTLTKEVISRGYRYFDWNVDSDDAGKAKTSEEVYNNVTRNLSKSKRNVVLMHDFDGNTKTLNALSRIIDYGLENGYTFSNITEITPMVTHMPNN